MSAGLASGFDQLGVAPHHAAKATEPMNAPTRISLPRSFRLMPWVSLLSAMGPSFPNPGESRVLLLGESEA